MEVIPSRSARRRTPLFITFYSFKGGVGRTMALLNVASILAGVGRNVLMIDFDLEAPGLTLFQDRQIVMSEEEESDSPVGDESRPSRTQEGLIDALNDFLDDPEHSYLMKDDTRPFFDQFVTSLSVPEALKKTDPETGEIIGPGRLDLMPSGRLRPDYEKRMRNLDFREMFREGVGRPLFDRLKDVVKKSDRQYDYVLIDSRTGFSDEGNICTRVLPECLVVLTGLNSQNVEGTGRFIERARLPERRQRVVFVASPVPAYYETVRNRRIQAAQSRFRDAGLDNVRFVAQIPYHPLLALEEDPRVQDLTGTALYDQYQHIADRVRKWANDQPDSRLNEAIKDLLKGDGEGLSLLRQVAAEKPDVVLEVLNSVGDALITADPKSAAKAFDFAYHLVDTEADPSTASDVLTLLGRAYGTSGELEKAISTHKRSLKINESAEGTSRTARDYFFLGRWHQVSGNAESALEMYDAAIDVARAEGDRATEAATLSNLGGIHHRRGNFDRAYDHYQQALDIAREIGNRSTEAAALGNLGSIASNRGGLDRALDYHREALDIAREIGDRSAEAAALGNLGNLASDQGVFDLALDYHRHTLDIAREIGDRSTEAAALVNLGNVSSKRGDLDHALNYHQQALDIARETGNRSTQTSALVNLGNVYSKRGALDLALDHYQQALDIAREIGDRSTQASALVNLGSVYSKRGALDLALNYHQQALDIAREIGDRSTQTAALGNLGNIASGRVELDRALDYHQQALDIAREIDDRTAEAYSLANISIVYARRGETENSEENIQRAISITSELGTFSAKAAILVDAAEARSYYAPGNALSTLREHWTLITEHAEAFERMQAHVLRARLRLEVENDREGAADDARTAAEFYRERGIDSRWSREAEDILKQLDD